jgi:hypothetical protein
MWPWQRERSFPRQCSAWMTPGRDAIHPGALLLHQSTTTRAWNTWSWRLPVSLVTEGAVLEVSHPTLSLSKVSSFLRVLAFASYRLETKNRKSLRYHKENVPFGCFTRIFRELSHPKSTSCVIAIIMLTKTNVPELTTAGGTCAHLLISSCRWCFLRSPFERGRPLDCKKAPIS